MKKRKNDKNPSNTPEQADRSVTETSLACTLICYLLLQVNEAIDSELLYEIAVTGGMVNYFTYQDAIQSVVDSALVQTLDSPSGETRYSLTPEGIVRAGQLPEVVEQSDCDRMADAARTAVARSRNQKDVAVSYEPLASGCHLHVRIQDDGLTLLQLKLFTPDFQQAEQLGEAILSNPSALYHDVLHAIIRQQDLSEQ